MNRLTRFISIILLLLLIQIPVLFMSIPLSEAQSLRTEVELTKPVGAGILPGGQVFQEDIKSSFIFAKLIPFAIKYAIRLAVSLAVVALIIGGYQFMTAYGDTEKHQKAQKTITYAIIGLILAITAFGIVEIITRIQLT